MKIIAFVGMPASGKSEAAHVVRNMGIDVVNMGNVIRKEVIRRGLEPTDANTGSVANDLRDKEGMDSIAKRCIPTIRDTGSNIVIIDGVRGIAEVECFKKEFGNDFTLISIDSPFELRFARVRKRGRSDDMENINALRQRDEREMGWGMAEAIGIADFVIENTTDLDDFRQNIKDTLEVDQ
ncbi:MAG: flagellar hook-basal body complex protein FliE [Methanosarcinaceae archaeon]|nr:flagellar hook-basal body complex protein FliE [Methanosarcinaceae archaeon]